MNLKTLILKLLSWSGASPLFERLPRFLHNSERLFGLRNPFHVSHYVVVREGGIYWAPFSSYLAMDAARKNLVSFKGDYEPEISYLLHSLVKPGDTVLDVGANVGLHTVALAKTVQDGEVFAFEPVPDLTNQLSVNLALNGISNVRMFGFGLGNTNDTLRMNVHVSGAGLEGTSSFLGTDHMEIGKGLYTIKDIPVKRLDDVVLDLKLKSRISMIKIDTEGFEPLVIEGGLNTIRRHRPAMIVEAHTTRLRKLNFSFCWYKKVFPDYHIFLVPETLPANPFLKLIPLTLEPPECCVNLLFLPKTDVSS